MMLIESVVSERTTPGFLVRFNLSAASDTLCVSPV